MEHWKAKGLDFSRLFNKPEAKPGTNITASAAVDRADASSQRPGETELVSIGVGQVEEPLAPFGVIVQARIVNRAAIRNGPCMIGAHAAQNLAGSMVDF